MHYAAPAELSRSEKACPRRLTNDLAGRSVCPVPREPDPEWVTEKRRAIGARVRAEREYANVTQERLEELAGVKRLTIQNIESGATDARVSWLLRISRALGIPASSLLAE